jgi:hypothetical protein
MTDPQLSIVIASCVGPPFILRCLASLETQREQGTLEFIVADRAGGEVAAEIEQRFPWVKLLRRPADESVPDLRRNAVEQAAAPYVAIIEEHCVAADDWIATILRKIAEPVAAIGGVVADDDYDRLMDWAVYFTEYNAYMPPVDPEMEANICGANCVYRRDLLLAHAPPSGSGYWEAELNHQLQLAGERLDVTADLVVRHTGPFRFCYYLGQRFLFSRAFAAARRHDVSPAFRVAYVLLAPLLVPLLMARTARRVVSKRQHAGKFLLVWPLLVPINMTYVLGEWVGFVAGAGDSLSRIE